jgi:hypothetical protein
MIAATMTSGHPVPMPTLSHQDRLSAWANEVREQADQLPPGPERDMLLMKAKQAHTASSYLNEWVNSRGLEPPR